VNTNHTDRTAILAEVLRTRWDIDLDKVTPDPTPTTPLQLYIDPDVSERLGVTEAVYRGICRELAGIHACELFEAGDMVEVIDAAVAATLYTAATATSESIYVTRTRLIDGIRTEVHSPDGTVITASYAATETDAEIIEYYESLPVDWTRYGLLCRRATAIGYRGMAGVEKRIDHRTGVVTFCLRRSCDGGATGHDDLDSVEWQLDRDEARVARMRALDAEDAALADAEAEGAARAAR
jgi:hypothetical protein